MAINVPVVPVQPMDREIVEAGDRSVGADTGTRNGRCRRVVDEPLRMIDMRAADERVQSNST